MNLMIKVFHVQDVNETREEEARGEDAADYDAADADYEQEDDAGVLPLILVFQPEVKALSP